jgi:DMSO/TMAO reductase YedYZ molybdopterin-dependent catalytic subunit
MHARIRPLLIICALLLVAGLTVFAAACGTAAQTTTTAAPTATTATTAAPSTDTTAPASTDTTAAAAATDTTAAAGTDTTEVDPSTLSGTIQVKGMVDAPSTITVDTLKGLGTVTKTLDHPKLGPTEYTGTLMSVLLPTLKIQPAATMVDFTCTDGYIAEVSLADIKASADSMLTIGKDGSLNAAMPGMYGKAWARDVITMEFK